MKWKQPPIIKVYEALGAVSDGRMEIEGNTAKVYSSSRGKFYDVIYDPEKRAIMANDNGSYFQGYLGYPAITFLLATGVLPFNPELADLLKGLAWKDINTKFKNDFPKTLLWIEERLGSEKSAQLAAYAGNISGTVAHMDLEMLGPKVKPPQGY